MLQILYNKLLKCKPYRLNSIRNSVYKHVNRVPFHKLDLERDAGKDEQMLKTPISLSSQIRTRIKMSGPITVAEYMKTVLTNPGGGYYMQRDVFGRAGDFITSPEITQIFGELIAIWMLNEWNKLGTKYPLQVVEFGAGRGTLMHDIIRVFSQFKISTRKISVHMIEISPLLARIQAYKLCSKSIETTRDEKHRILHYREGEGLDGLKYYWYSTIDDLPKKKFSIYLAHEFFDALPIHKFQRTNPNQWREILVDFDPENETKFRLIQAKGETAFLKLVKPHLNMVDPKRNHVEYSVETDIIMDKLTKRIEVDGGIGLIIDYGHNGEKEDTFRAFRQHKLHDPMVEPGTADLTADVNFTHLKSVCERDSRLIPIGPMNQGDFLKNMGGDFRLEVLLQSAKPDQRENIQSAYEMLTNPAKGMADRYKFFAMFPTTTKQILEKYRVSGFYFK